MATMATGEDVPGGSVVTTDANVVSGADGQRGGGLSSSALALSNNPQAKVPEGLNTTTVTIPAPVLPTLPTLPAIPSSVPVAILRSSARNPLDSPLLRGPLPQKGSGQDRFRQELLKGNDYAHLAAADQSNSFAVPSSTRTIQRLTTTPRRSSPDHTTVNPPFFALRATTSACPGTQEKSRAIATPSQVKGGMSPEVKIKIKKASLIQLKPKTGEAHIQSSRQTGSNYPLATARLSAQCQLRHFNPKWQETSGPNGFKCSVQLVNKVVHGDRAYPTAYDAKQAVAEKALGLVRRLPCEDPAQKVAARIKSGEQTDRFSEGSRQGRAQVKSEPSVNASHASRQGQYAYVDPAGANAVAYNWNAYSHNEHRALLHRIHSLFGGAGPSTAVLSDPLAAQAFLQGLALGTSIRPASSVYHPYLEPQGPLPAIPGEIYRPYEPRERSPAPNLSRNYRDRSPLRQRVSYESSSRQSNSRAL